MIDEIDAPVATAAVRWVSASDGGRRSGPPTAPVYAATCVFPLGGEAEVKPGWPGNADPTLSILIQRVEQAPDGADLAKIDFLFPDVAMPYVHVGADILVLEGAKVVAHAVVREVLRSPADRSGREARPALGRIRGFFSSFRERRPPGRAATGGGGAPGEQELWALLRELDGRRHVESPLGLRDRAARAKFGQLVVLVERAFGCTAVVDDDMQDSNCLGMIVIPAGATDSGEHLTITVSNVGDLAAPTLGTPGSYSEEEALILLDPSDRARIDGALRALGYVIVSEFPLWARYDGVIPLTGSPQYPPTWWDRFFGYL